MKRSQLQQAIKRNTKIDIPMLIESAPGLGKTSIIEQVHDEENRHLFSLILSMRQPVDLTGLPVPNLEKLTVQWLQCGFLPPSDFEGPCTLFIDELANCSGMMQTAALSLVHERRIGSYTLPSQCTVIAATNRASDKAGSNQIITSMRSRFKCYTFDADLNDWVEWAQMNGIHPYVIAYVRRNPDHLHFFDPRNVQENFPCPRTWEMISKVEYLLENDPIEKADEIEEFGSAIGNTIALEYTAFRRCYNDMPDPALIFMDPENAPLPDQSRPDVCFMLSASLGKFATSENVGRLIQYLERWTEEYNVLTIQDVLRRNKDAKTKEYTDDGKKIVASQAVCNWIAKHQHVYI